MNVKQRKNSFFKEGGGAVLATQEYFDPTDEELIVHYLKPKNSNHPIPTKRIPTANVYQFNPKQLTEMYLLCKATEWYFFTSRNRKYLLGKMMDTRAGNGYWRPNSAEEVIFSDSQPVGFKRTLCFYEGDRKKSAKTDWIMKEYRVDQRGSAAMCRTPCDKKVEGWVLCKIYKQSEKGKSKLELGNEEMPIIIPSEVTTAVPMLQSDEDPLLFNKACPSGIHDRHSSMPGSLEENILPFIWASPPGLHDIDSLMSAHIGQSCLPELELDHHDKILFQCCLPELELDHHDKMLLDDPPHISEIYNTYSQMPSYTGEKYFLEPLSDQDPPFSNFSNPSGIYDTYALMPGYTGEYCFLMLHLDQDSLLAHTPHVAEMHNTNAQMFGNARKRCSWELQLNQDLQLTKRHQLFGMHHVHYDEENCFPAPKTNQDLLLPNWPHPYAMHYTDSQMCGHAGQNCFPKSAYGFGYPISDGVHRDNNYRPEQFLSRDVVTFADNILILEESGDYDPSKLAMHKPS